MTPYEKMVHSAIGYVLSGEDGDAKDELNDILKTTNDPFIQNFVDALDEKVSICIAVDVASFSIFNCACL